MWWWVGALVMGCGVEVEDGDLPETEFRVLDGTTEELVCPETRQIARLTEGAPGCPQVQNWARTRLFVNGTPYLASLDEPANGVLSRYCSYDWTGEGAPNPAIFDQLPGWIAERAPDCAAMRAEGSLTTLLEPILRNLVAEHLDLVSDTDLANTPRSPVHVKIVDTIPADEPLVPRDPHGLVVAGLVRDIACPGTALSCVVDVENVLGLPLYKDQSGVHRGWTRGGYFGHISETGTAIVEAVKRWEHTTYVGERPKLILNLSVGFEPFWFHGVDPNDPTPAVEMMERALRYARCRGAFITVAAGNESQTCEQGPLAPGLWEQRAAPTPGECHADFGIQNAPLPLVPGPLVFAVGGLEYDDAPLTNGRAGGRPRLAAIASHVPGLETTDSVTRTGTSMAAAAAAGAAAVAWSIDPDLTADELGELLWASGRQVGGTADFGYVGYPKTELDIHAISVCRAAREACERAATCPAGTALTCHDEYPIDTTPLRTAIEDLVPDDKVDVGFEPVDECITYCDIPVEVLRSKDPAANAPTACEAIDGPSNTSRLTAPQPETPACPTCTIYTSSGNAYATEALANDSLAIEYVKINIGLLDGTLWNEKNFGGISLSSSRTTRLYFGAMPDPDDIAYARITIKYVGFDPITDPLQIIQPLVIQ